MEKEGVGLVGEVSHFILMFLNCKGRGLWDWHYIGIVLRAVGDATIRMC